MSTPLRERPDAPLGTLIFRAGLLPAETIESALQESSRTGKRLGEILLERKLLQEAELSRLLAGQKGLPFVSLRERGVDVAAARLFSEDQARLYRALPFQIDSGSPVVAISDPTNEVVMRNIREALDGTEVQFAVATKSELTELMVEIYNPNGNGPNGNGNGHANGNGSNGNGASAGYEAPAPAAVIAEPEPVEIVTEPSVSDAAPVVLEPVLEPAAEAVAEPVADPEPAAVEPVAAPEPELPAQPEPLPVQEAAISDPEPLEQPSVHRSEPEPEAPPAPAPIERAPLQVAPAPMPEPAPLRVAPKLEPAPAPEPESPVGTATVRVVIRLSNNDRVDAAAVGDPRAAKAQAQALIRYIAGKDGSDWPFVGGRFLRPDAIVSVDLVEQIPGETGSA
jgi:Type II secretion system (T2SS), protein E, N-terminal domain